MVGGRCCAAQGLTCLGQVEALIQELWNDPRKAWQPAQPWDSFLGCGGGLRGVWRSYGVPSARIFAQHRLEENVLHFWGNYVRVALGLCLSMVIRRPLSLLGGAFLLVLWDQHRRFSATTRLNRESMAFQAINVGASVVAWLLVVLTNLTVALFWAAVAVLSFVYLHGTFRMAPGEGKFRRVRVVEGRG